MRTFFFISTLTLEALKAPRATGFTHSAPRIRHNSALVFSSRSPLEKIQPASYDIDSSSEANDEFDPLKLTIDSSNEGTGSLLTSLGKEGEETEEISLWAARGILLAVAAVWGTNFACVKYLNDLCFHPPCNHPPSEFAFARFGIAAIFSIPLLLKQPKDVILAGFECGLWITLGYISQSMALDTISSGQCAFICSLTVVFVPIVSYILYRKPLKFKDFAAGATAVFGVAVLEGMVDFQTLLGIAPAMAAAQDTVVSAAASEITSSSIDIAATGIAPTMAAAHDTVVSAATSAITSSSMDTAAAGPIALAANGLGVAPGDLLALGQPLGFGFAFTRIEHYQEKFEKVPSRVLTIAAAQCVMVGILSFFWVLYDYHGVFPNFGYMVEIHRIATLAWTGIVTTLVAIYFEGIALQKATATDASIAFSSEPVWASLFGFLLLHETLGFDAYVGGAIIMSACLIGALSDLAAPDDSHD